MIVGCPELTEKSSILLKKVLFITKMNHPSSPLLIAAFYMLGLWSLFPQAVVAGSAVEDILTGTLWPTTVVIFTNSFADFLSKSTSPFIVRRISFNLSFGVLTFLLVGSLVLLVAIDDVRLRVVGVFMIGIAYGYTIITGVSMLTYYEKADTLANALQNGTNGAVFLASFVYTGLTTWLCVAARIAIAACIPLCFIPLGIYLSLDKEHLQDHLSKTTVQYAMLTNEEDSEEQEKPIVQPSWLSKLKLLFKAFPFLGYAYVTSFCTHSSIMSVLSTLTFPSAPFLPRDHYQYYRMLSDAGKVVGGLWILVVTCFGEKGREFFRIRKIWLLVTLNVVLLFFFVFASWYRVLPNAALTLALCFIQGFLHGTTVVYCAEDITSLFTCPADRSTALGLMQIALSVSRLTTAVSGFFVEPYLREHCTNQLMLGQFCLARHASRGEWNMNPKCKI